MYKLFAITGEPSRVPLVMVQVTINQAPLQMKEDTRASVFLISGETLWPDEQGQPELQHSASQTLNIHWSGIESLGQHYS